MRDVIKEDSPLKHSLRPHLPELASFPDTKTMEASPLFRRLKPEMERILSSIEIGGAEPSSEKRASLRLVSWNIERGKNFQGIAEALKSHAVLKHADVIMLQEVDLGMARSQNRHVARELANELEMAYYYVPGFIELSKGSRDERLVDGENTWSLQGQALLTRVKPLMFDEVAINPVRDRMRGDEKCIGQRRGLLFTLPLKDKRLSIANVHLDHHTSGRGRAKQLAQVFDRLLETAPQGPAVVCGDMNATTYNLANKASFLACIVEKAVRGVFWSAHHYMHPYARFEPMFDEAVRRDFDYEEFNDMWRGSVQMDITDEREYLKLTEYAPRLLADLTRDAIMKYGGRTPMKLDWFFVRDAVPLKRGAHLSNDETSVGAAVVDGLTYEGERVSDHDPIVLDLTC